MKRSADKPEHEPVRDVKARIERKAAPLGRSIDRRGRGKLAKHLGGSTTFMTNRALLAMRRRELVE
jgi:hypothetical protein